MVEGAPTGTAGDYDARVVLSPRESEVLAAVARHRTNAEIAAELYISVRTVESHVSSLLRKLGAADRRALVAHAGTALLSVDAGDAPGLVGRDDDVSRLWELLASPGLVTVVGPGGVGKTSLVRTLGGAVIVDLTTLPAGAGPGLTASAALAACGQQVPEGRTAVEALAAEVTRRHLVLVLDNCEHVLEGAAEVAGALIRTPGVRVVATSRERLGLPAERLLHLAVLEPDAALELFGRRAAALDPPVVLSTAQGAQAAAVCASVEYLPLAVELAAARLGQLGLDDLVDAVRVDIDVLDGGSRGRHRSMRSMLDWSYGLLAPADQRVHRWLSVLPGAFQIPAASAIAGGGRSVAASVARLVDASLLARVDSDRYRQLDPVRADAAQRLVSAGELGLASAALLRWASERLDADDGTLELAGLRAAAVVATDLADGGALGLLRRLAGYWTGRGAWQDAIETWERAARVSADPADALAAAELAWMRWHGDDALRMFRLAAGLAEDAGDAHGLVQALEGQIELGLRFPATLEQAPDIASLQLLLHRAEAVDTGSDLASESRVACAEALVRSGAGDHAGARESARRAVSLAEAARQAVLESAAWDALSAAAWNEGDAATVHDAAERRLGLRGRLDHSPRAEVERSDVQTMAVEGALAVGLFAEARARADELLVRERARGLAHVALGRLATCEFHLGEFDGALAHTAEAVREWEAYGGGPARYLLPAITACIAISGYRAGDEDEHSWVSVAEKISNRRGGATASPLLRALRADVHLFHGRVDLAAHEVASSPWEVSGPRSLYAAVRAAVLGGEAVRDAERLVLGDRYAEAIVARARGDLDQALDLFRACGAAFEAARTRVMMGDDDARKVLAAFLVPGGRSR